MLNIEKPLEQTSSVEQVNKEGFQGKNHDLEPILPHDLPITGSPQSISKAVRALSLLLNANEDAIDDLFRMIDTWEEITGHQFFTDQHISVKSRPKSKSNQPSNFKSDKNLKPDVLPENDVLIANRAKAILKERNLQFKDMPSGLKSDKFVRILLVLLIDTLSGKAVQLTSIGYAIGRPQTSVMRYLQELGKHDLISRNELPSDGRVTLIKLTGKGESLARTLTGRAIDTFPT